jgi:hypothetical protein
MWSPMFAADRARISKFEHGAMWKIEHIRLIPLRTQSRGYARRRQHVRLLRSVRRLPLLPGDSLLVTFASAGAHRSRRFWDFRPYPDLFSDQCSYCHGFRCWMWFDRRLLRLHVTQLTKCVDAVFFFAQM